MHAAPGGHSLEQRQAEALVEGRKAEDGAEPVEGGEVVVGHLAQQRDLLSPRLRAREDLLVVPAARADDGQPVVVPQPLRQLREGLDHAGQVLARLERAGAEDERAVERVALANALGLAGRGAGGERLADARVDHGRPGAGRGKAADEIASGRARIADDPLGPSDRERQGRPFDARRPAVRVDVVAERDQIVDDERRRDSQEPRGEVARGCEKDVAVTRGVEGGARVPDGIGQLEQPPGEALVERLLPPAAPEQDIGVRVVAPRELA